MSIRFATLLALACSFLFSSVTFAKLRVAQIFQDNMVLQRDLPAPVWGWADAGTKVTITFAGQSKTATADAGGYWKVTLDPVAASSDGRPLVVDAGGDKVERRNVVVGEVWILSGQSNMARALKNDSFDNPYFKDYSNDADYPLIRFTNFGTGATLEPLADVEPVLRKETPWKVLSKPTSVEVMSIGFFFAKRLHAELKVPVGLVQVAVPGTPQTAWMARETLEALPGENGNANYYRSSLADGESKLARAKSPFKTFADYEAKLPQWRSDPAATERSWPGDNVVTDFPTSLYNTRMHPLAPLAFRGMLWHQGEAGPGGAYGPRMVAMIKQHRALFGRDFTFIFGTLTRKTASPPPMSPVVSNFGAINQSMIDGDRLFGEDGNAALVNFFDLGNPGTHWAMKEEAGRRMFLAALDRAYGKPQLFTGPQLIEGKINGNTAVCTFRYTGTGLRYEPSIDGISGVVLVDKKNKRYWADVKVTAPNTLTISHPAVTDIAGVFYGCHTNPHETLFNDANFPAFAFTVGAAPTAKPEEPFALITPLTPLSDKVTLHVSHVRSNGYVFGVMESRSANADKITFRAYVPASWKGVEVRIGGDVVQPEKIETVDGRTFVHVTAAVNGPNIVVAEVGSTEGLSRIDRR